MRVITWVLIAFLVPSAVPQERTYVPPKPNTNLQISRDPKQSTHGHPSETQPGTPPCGYRTYQCPPNNSDQPPNRDNPPRDNNDDHTARNVAIGVGVGALAGLALTEIFMHHGDHMDTLSQKGPQFPDLLHMSRFQVTGFLRASWPMILDYEAEQNSYTVLTIVPESGQQFTTVLPTQQAGRQRIRMTAPANIGGDLRIANFTIVSTRSKTNPQLAFFRVYGFGAGPRAIGSVAIDQLTIGPGIITAAQPNAQVGFHAHTAFDKVNAEFMQLTLVDNCMENKKFDDMPFKGRVLENNIVQDNWNGKKSHPGQIQFRVRGWFAKENGGDWVSAFSPQLVQRQ